MKFNSTIKGNIELQSAIAKIIETARLLQLDCYSVEDKFSMAWNLGFRHLRDLEDFRKPE